MLNLIKHLVQNPEILNLWKDNKVSIIGIHSVEEKKQILKSFEENRNIRKIYWK